MLNQYTELTNHDKKVWYIPIWIYDSGSACVFYTFFFMADVKFLYLTWNDKFSHLIVGGTNQGYIEIEAIIKLKKKMLYP